MHDSDHLAGKNVQTDRLVGIWTTNDGSQISELLLRSDGRYQLDARSTSPDLPYSSCERGRYAVDRQLLTLTPYYFFGEPSGKSYTFKLSGQSLSLARVDFELTEVYELVPGSPEDVLERQKAASDLIRRWSRTIENVGQEEYTFRPDGHYFRKSTPGDAQFPPEFIRGRYETGGSRLTLKPYSSIEFTYELDFFGNTLTLISSNEYSGDSASYDEIPASGAEVRKKAAEAAAFLGTENWQAGIWEIRDLYLAVDLTLRPDGYFIARHDTESLGGIVRGRYTLAPGRIQFSPFPGQDQYARSGGDFGKYDHGRNLDYYDGELQFIDPQSISQKVILARKRQGTQRAVIEKTRQAQAEREHEAWYVGVWEVHDPAGTMEFTYRPDNRYIVKSGSGSAVTQVERGRYVMSPSKLTLEPYAPFVTPRGFELDLYEGDCFLIGDVTRLVIARKISRSEAGVVEKTRNPASLKSERGAILGRWSANLPEDSAELIFRTDGQYRLNRCLNNAVAQDYGLYSVDMFARALVSDSRFTPLQTLGMDFYDNTLTIFGGDVPPSTYVVNLGTVDSAIAASFAADTEEARVDAQWLTRVPIGPRDPQQVQIPAGDIPADPNPGRVFDGATVLSQFQFYRRLIAGFVYFNVQGVIKTVPIVNSRESYFFSTGRVLVRFKNYQAGPFYPGTIAHVTNNWGAYRIEPKPAGRDILHIYADNGLWIESDAGERIEMTLEDGRRNLFWGKDFQLMSEWAADLKPVPCVVSAPADPSLLNTGISLSTLIEPDPVGDRYLQRTLIGHSAAVCAVTLLEDVKQAVSASADKTLKLWNIESGQVLRSLAGHSASVCAVALVPGGRQVVSASADKTLKMWDLESGQQRLELKGHTGSVTAIAIWPDGKHAVSGSTDKTLRLWDLQSGKMISSIKGHSARITGVALPPDGKRLVSASADRTVKLWDVESGKLIRTFEGHSAAVLAVAVMPDGKRAVSASADKTLKLWDVENGQALLTLAGHCVGVLGVAAIADGKRVISSSTDHTLKLWSLETASSLSTLIGHIGAVAAVAVSVDGQRAVSASHDLTLKIWNLGRH
jgi:WD40 repeat protein